MPNPKKGVAAMFGILLTLLFLAIVFFTAFDFIQTNKEMQDTSKKATEIFLGTGTP